MKTKKTKTVTKKIFGWEMLRKLAKDAEKYKHLKTPKDLASNDDYLYKLP